MNRRLFIALVGALILGSTLLIQRSMVTYYTYRCSELEQHKKQLSRRLDTLDVELRRRCSHEILYRYWEKRRGEFAFISPDPKQATELSPQEENITTFTSFKKVER